MRTNPFARAKMMFAAIAAAMSLPSIGQQQAAMDEIGPYRSRGNGKGMSNRRPRGAGMAAHRASVKARNVKRHRAACRG